MPCYLWDNMEHSAIAQTNYAQVTCMRASNVILQPTAPAGTRSVLKAGVLSRFERKNRRQESRATAHADLQGYRIAGVRWAAAGLGVGNRPLPPPCPAGRKSLPSKVRQADLVLKSAQGWAWRTFEMCLFRWRKGMSRWRDLNLISRAHAGNSIQ